MIVTATVPSAFRFKAILESFYKETHVQSSPSLESQFAWLIQITSWAYGVDWNPLADTVTVELPLSSSLKTGVNRVDTVNDNYHPRLKRKVDFMSDMLILILADVSPERVLAHFPQQ